MRIVPLVVMVFLLCTNISNPRNTLLLPLSAFLLLVHYRRALANVRVTVQAGLVAGFALTITILYSILLNGISANQTIVFHASLALIYHLVLVALLYRDLDMLRAVVNTVLAVFVTSFLIQLSVFYLTGVYIDLREFLGGGESKIGDASVLSSLWGLPSGLVRATSFFNEPGTFASVLIQLLLISFVAEGRYRLLHWLAVSCLFLTFSTFGIMQGVFFIFYSGIARMTMREGRLVGRMLLAVAVFSVAVISLFFAIDYVEGRFITNHKNDGGFGFRIAWLEHWLDSGLFAQLLGRGFGFWDSAYAYGAGIYLEDIGMWFHLAVNLGIIGVVVLWMFRYYARSWLALGAIAMLMLSKNVFYSYSMLMTLALLMCAQARTKTAGPMRATLTRGAPA